MKKNNKTEITSIPTGSTLLNLALTGEPKEGWGIGKISSVWGGSASGKTLLAVESAATFQKLDPNNQVFYLESESAFNESFAERVGLDLSRFDLHEIGTVEEMYDKLVEILEKEQGAFIIVDSIDGLSSDQELSTDIHKGTMAMNKQKKLSEIFRRVTNIISDKNSHLMMISQERDNVSGYGAPTKRAGGRAIQFYCSQVVYLKRKEKLENKKTERTYGVVCEAVVQKNRADAPERKVEFPILYSHGIDDVVSVVNFLHKRSSFDKSIFEGFGNSKGYYTIPSIGNYKSDGKKLHFEPMIQQVLNDPELVESLLEAGAKLWAAIEEETKVTRPSKRLN